MATKDQALAVYNSYLALNPDGNDLSTILHENLGDGAEIGPGLLPRIKMPTGGGRFWDMGTTSDVSPPKDLDVIILYSRLTKAYWQSQNPQAGNPPDCYSDDMRHGVGIPGGECAACPYNQFESRRYADGTPGRGKACKDSRVLWMLLPESPLPVQLRLPPTSLQPAVDYLMNLTMRSTLYWQVVTRLGLRQVEGNVTYSVATFQMVGRLDIETEERVREMRERYIPQLNRIRLAVDTDAA